MSDYFLSDVHLRDDRPERGRRLVQFLQRIKPGEDRLIIAGDLCDFWMGSRKSPQELVHDEALSGLAEFREAGGALSILPGNHDRWLVPFYESSLRATILTDPYEMESHGLKIHIVHGHLLGARRLWKAAMESREFFRIFGAIPSSTAKPLDNLLESRNRRGLEEDESRHLAVYRIYADSQKGMDLAVFGHVHRAVDDAGSPRMIVLGGWQTRSSYLKIDPIGAVFHVESSDADEPTSTGSRRAQPSNATP